MASTRGKAGHDDRHGRWRRRRRVGRPAVSQTAERIRASAEADPRWHAVWAIQTHAGRLAGAINYHAHNEQQRRLAVGWIVVPSLWRQGIMTEAAPPVISHCFTELNVHRIEARIEPENGSSRRLAARLGFTEEGLLRDWLIVAASSAAS